MPAAWALLLLLLGLSARGPWGCLHCLPPVLETLERLRSALVPGRFTVERLQRRADALLLGMEGTFFRDYSLNAFVGRVEPAELDVVASFTENQAQKIKAGSLRDEPLLEELVSFRRSVIEELKKVLKQYEEKDTLEGDVLDCFLCQNICSRCIKHENCFVDRQPRLALRYDTSQERYPRSQAVLGAVTSVGLALFIFAVILISACTYRQNRRLLLQ
ncbi:izumo sperm-egg fusion protein 2 isoform X2 [Tamandua tetradactyla]|uniref:izumo sperm-egg fusion protein 2 isoform X2 n=1 Tax=Tamandua tetradactyla TaxID=48850 RepID=UPI004053CA59